MFCYYLFLHSLLVAEIHVKKLLVKMEEFVLTVIAFANPASTTQTVVLKFPLKDSNGFVWDAGNTADIFPAIRSFSGGPFIWNDPLIHLTNADNTTEYSFDIIPSLEFTDLIHVNTIEIDLYDNDGANNTLMGNSTQDIYSSGAHEFPESLVTVYNSIGYQFRVHFEYEW